jgi:hypothetical protein
LAKTLKRKKDKEEWIRKFGDLLADDVGEFRPFFEAAYQDPESDKKPPSKTEDMMARGEQLAFGKDSASFR